MGRRKSFVSTLLVEQALHSHNCRFNVSHRLTAKEGMEKLRYCAECAVTFLRGDIETIEAKIREIEAARKQNSG